MSAPGTLEALVVDEWLFARLNGDATLRALLNVEPGDRRVASPVAPASWGDGPFVTYAEQAPMDDVRVVGPHRVFAEGLWTVKAVRKANSWADPLRAVAQRIDVLLHGATGTVASGEVLACHRETTLHYPEADETGAEWRHLGGVYRIVAT